jgi:hypothetical protein
MNTKKQQYPEEIKDLMREVEDDMAFESLKKGIKRYGPAIALVVVATLLGIGGSTWYHKTQDQKALQAEDVFTSLVYPDTQTTKGIPREEDLTSSSGYQTLVAFAEGQRHLSHDRLAEAGDTWQKSLRTAPLPLRNLLESLQALAQSQTSPWRFLAQEARAFSLYAAGDKVGAKKIWDGLSKVEGLPSGVRERTQTMLKSFL